MTASTDQHQAAKVLRRILDAARTGALAADDPAGKRITRRLEGAVSALEAAGRTKGGNRGE